MYFIWESQGIHRHETISLNIFLTFNLIRRCSVNMKYYEFVHLPLSWSLGTLSNSCIYLISQVLICEIVNSIYCKFWDALANLIHYKPQLFPWRRDHVNLSVVKFTVYLCVHAVTFSNRIHVLSKEYLNSQSFPGDYSTGTMIWALIHVSFYICSYV